MLALCRVWYNRHVITVYIETSFFSACVSRRNDPQSTTWRTTSKEWWKTQRRRLRLCISEEVIAELSPPGFSESQRALEMLHGLELLELSPEVQGLARILVKEKVMPGPAITGDAIHVAAATVYAMDYLLSWAGHHFFLHEDTRQSLHFRRKLQ